jgi:DNA sulfur modification protein DndD
MSNELKFLGWKSRGLRCPDHEIDLTNDGDPASIALIQMPNGTGKTTSLELLRATMSGSAPDGGEWDPETVRSYRKRGPEKTRIGVFAVFFEVDDNRATIKLTLNFANGKARYDSTYGAGKQDRFNAPRPVRRFMTPGFVRFFIFDGELAENLLDSSKTDAERAIEDLFRMKILNAMASRVEEHWRQKTSDQRVKRGAALEKHIDKYERSKERLDKVKALKKQDEKKLKQKRHQLRQKEKQFEDELQKRDNTQNRRAEAKGKLQRWQSQVESLSAQVLDKMRSPNALSETFAEEIIQLKRSLDRVQLPERTAREFFEELAEEDECICGRELDRNHRETIRDRADQYLGSDDVAFLNAMKRDIGTFEESTRDGASDLESAIQSLIKATEKEKHWQTELDDAEAAITSSDPRAAEIREEVEDLEREVDKLEEKMERYDDRSEQPGINETWGIEVLERRVERHKRKAGEVAEALDLLRKKDKLESILNTAHDVARKQVSDEICRDANERIKTLMPNNDIRIDEIDRSLRLQNRGMGSVGETLTIGYAFLSTLFNRSNYSIPFIVDSPANPIDLDIRKQIGSIIPEVSHQFIAFTISSEREGFVTSLQDSSGDEIKYMTLFRKGIDEAQTKMTSEPDHLKHESSDGWCVEGPSFFNSFQVDEDPNQ